MTTQASSTRIRVQTIDHVTIVVKDLEKSRCFYEDLLGMESVARPDFGFPGQWFQAGRTQIHTILESPEAGSAGLPPFAGTHPSRGFHFAFEVADCDAATDLLRDRGIAIVSGPRSRPDGARQVYVHDPDGHLVELTSGGPQRQAC